MKTYHLNMVLDDSENLVASYDSLGKFQTFRKQDAHNYLVRHAGENYNALESGVSWYPYFTCEEDNGDIRELSFSEVRGGAV
ncbi:MAG: hypothetical protein LBK83_11485 [Treponema sp.]|jgi:hypothetical protein|nr:hypothetical protein [Treponema sp.]